MNLPANTLVLAAVAALTAGQATAQPYGDRGREPVPSATLYEGPNFQGRQVTVYAYGENLAGMNFNDLAGSARFEGRWRVCEDSRYRGRCQDLSGQIADLDQVGMGRKISSLQGYYEGWGAQRWEGREAFEGATGVLFPYPSYAGYDVAAGSSAADAFCRAMRLSGSAYYASSERKPQALDGDGRYMGDTDVLRDVLCRR